MSDNIFGINQSYEEIRTNYTMFMGEARKILFELRRAGDNAKCAIITNLMDTIHSKYKEADDEEIEVEIGIALSTLWKSGISIMTN